MEVINNIKIKELPLDDRPREKAIKYGIEICSNAELIAIILGSGTKNYNVLTISRNIIKNVNNLSEIPSLTLKELSKFEGINKIRGLQLQAAILLGERVAENDKHSLTFKDYKSIEIYKKYKNKILDEFQEKAYLIFINNKGKIIEFKEFTGTTFNINMDFNVIKCLLFDIKPKKLIIIHSHIEGDSTPSNEDINLTIKIENICKENGTLLLDHIIISREDYFSFKDHKFFE